MAPESKHARNERRKAPAATLNAIGVAAMLATVVQVLLRQAVAGETILIGIAIFIGTQGALHAVLRGLEDKSMDPGVQAMLIILAGLAAWGVGALIAKKIGF